MTLQAAFSERDISPQPGALNMGHLVEAYCDFIRDPLNAHVVIFKNDDTALGFVSLDVLSIRWSTAQEIRRQVTEKFGFPGENLMVAATHSHAGPATARAGDVPRDDEYLAFLVEQAVTAVGEALEALQPVQVAFARSFEYEVAYNRRVLMRDSTARCHGTFDDPDALCYEGPVDPEVAVLAVRILSGDNLGCLVNYACHPTHYGSTAGFSAGFPGHLIDNLKVAGWPCAVYLSGACGNLHTAKPAQSGTYMPAEEAGQRLAADVAKAVEAMPDWTGDVPLRSMKQTLELQYRQPTEEQIEGKNPGAQRFGSSEAYDRRKPYILERIASRKTQPAEVQVNTIGDCCFASIPAEYFCEFGLRIKLDCWPLNAMVVSCANGMIGYVPTPWAIEHGGYETTFTESSRMAPQTGDELADAAINLIKS